MQILSYSKRFTKEIILVFCLLFLSFLCGCNGCCSFNSNDPFKVVHKIHNPLWVDNSGKEPVVYKEQYYIVVSRTNSCGKEERHSQLAGSNLYYSVKIGDVYLPNY